MIPRKYRKRQTLEASTLPYMVETSVLVHFWQSGPSDFQPKNHDFYRPKSQKPTQTVPIDSTRGWSKCIQSESDRSTLEASDRPKPSKIKENGDFLALLSSGFGSYPPTSEAPISELRWSLETFLVSRSSRIIQTLF